MRARMPFSALCLAAASLMGCSVGTANPSVDHDPLDLMPVASFVTPTRIDSLAHCVADHWQALTALEPAFEVTLHPGFRGLIVDVKGPGDPMARAYIEAYPVRGRTRVDYFVRGFAQDRDENLRLRALSLCL